MWFIALEKWIAWYWDFADIVVQQADLDMALATARVKLSENVPTVRSTSKTEETWDGGIEE